MLLFVLSVRVRHRLCGQGRIYACAQCARAQGTNGLGGTTPFQFHTFFVICMMVRNPHGRRHCAVGHADDAAHCAVQRLYEGEGMTPGANQFEGPLNLKVSQNFFYMLLCRCAGPLAAPAASRGPGHLIPTAPPLWAGLGSGHSINKLRSPLTCYYKYAIKQLN